MHYSLCPFCFNELLSSIESNAATISCSHCKNSFLQKLCISDNDIIIPIITSELTKELTKELLQCILNLTIGFSESSNSTITKIERVSFHLDEYSPIVKLTDSRITSIGDYNTSVRYRFTKRRFIINTSFNVIFVFGRGDGLWRDDYSPYNYLKYAKKLIIAPNNNNIKTIISNFAHLFKSLNNIVESKKIYVPIALFNVSDLSDNSLFIIEAELGNYTIIPYVKNIEEQRIIDYSLLIKWITER